MSCLLNPSVASGTDEFARDTFVYEYLGEVIGPAPFARRMKEYAAEGIRHFYFMALDREIVSPPPFLPARHQSNSLRLAVHRRNKERWQGTIPQPFLQPQLRRREVDDRQEDAHGNLHQARCQEGRGAHVQLQR